MNDLVNKLDESNKILDVLTELSIESDSINVYEKETKEQIRLIVLKILELPRTNGCWISYALTKCKKSELAAKIKKVLVRMIEDYTRQINDLLEKQKQDMKTKELSNSIDEDKWLAENYPNGTECHLDDNICECEKYIMGEKRCSCGNKRISYSIECYDNEFYLILEDY